MEHKKSVNTGPDTSRTQLYRTSTLTLSRNAKQRLKWMDHFGKYRNVRLTCRHFGISPDTFYLWRKRFVRNNRTALEDDLGTRRPHKLRTSMLELKHRETIRLLKNVAPNMGKIRISKILRETGHTISASTVGRILKANKRLTLGSK
jgi:hypothetical protein